MRSKPIIFVVFFVILTTTFIVRFSHQQPQPPTQGQVKSSATTLVSLSIGGYHFRLYGYTSPKALVTIDGMGIYDQTYADEKGYFSFNNSFSPFSPHEACLTAQDQFGRVSSPTCLPPFPVKYNVDIGPVLIPPTVSLDKPYYYIDDQVVLSGQSIPNTDVNLSLFTAQGKLLANEKLDVRYAKLDIASHLALLTSLVKPVEAFSFPQLTSHTDSKGNFSISLPSAQAQTFRMFTQTSFDKENSGKSTTLLVKILPIWMIIIQYFLYILNLLKPHIVEITIIVELLAVAYYLLRLHFLPHIIARNRSIVLRPSYLPEVEELSLMKAPKEELMKIN